MQALHVGTVDDVLVMACSEVRSDQARMPTLIEAGLSETDGERVERTVASCQGSHGAGIDPTGEEDAKRNVAD